MPIKQTKNNNKPEQINQKNVKPELKTLKW